MTEQNTQDNMRLVKSTAYCALCCDYVEKWTIHSIEKHGYEIVNITESTITKKPKAPKPMFQVDHYEEICD